MAELSLLINKLLGARPQNGERREKMLHNQEEGWGGVRCSKLRVFYAPVDNGPAFRALRVHM